MLCVIPVSDRSWKRCRNSLKGTPSRWACTPHRDRKAARRRFSSFRLFSARTDKKSSKVTCREKKKKLTKLLVFKNKSILVPIIQVNFEDSSKKYYIYRRKNLNHVQTLTTPFLEVSLASKFSCILWHPSLNLFLSQRSMSRDCFLSISFLLGVLLAVNPV